LDCRGCCYVGMIDFLVALELDSKQRGWILECSHLLHFWVQFALLLVRTESHLAFVCVLLGQNCSLHLM